MTEKADVVASVNRSDANGDGFGNPETFFGWAIVAFVDLLGFSESITSLWTDVDESPLGRLLRIKDAALRIPATSLIAYTPSRSADAKVYRCRVHTVSDSIAICGALPTRRRLSDLTGTMFMVSLGVQAAWAAAIAEGYTIRGAIELGQIYWSESETIGPALADSYLLESKIADTSRVIFGPRFLQNLLECMNADWPEWPASKSLSVSDDNLIEMPPHHLKELLKGDLTSLEFLPCQFPFFHRN